MSILKMNKRELSCVTFRNIKGFLTPDEVVHIAKTMGAFWAYDYEAADKGKVGMHAELKSGLHSDGFFVSRILLEQENIRRIFSAQIAKEIGESCAIEEKPTCVVGVPDGATTLGKDIGEQYDINVLEMRKTTSGKIVLVSSLGPKEKVLLIEDFCTRGTGFIEAVLSIKKAQPKVCFVPYNPVIINRGGLKNILVPGVGDFKILSVVDWRVQDWDPKQGCPLCDRGSIPIKPKVSDANWKALTTSQL
ncbi:MAG: hypothetical protein KJ757_06120 [Planctomycetes bacterium]|nr:hypothetical protein [Planctomycetota bacterium]